MANVHNENNYNINPSFVTKQKTIKPLQYYIDGLKNGDRYILSEAITLVESEEWSRKEIASQLIDHVHHFSSNDAIRIAITGAPGVGKSTFIENFGFFLAEKNEKIAVIAIDPSSQLNKGSIMGDKTRMPQLSTHHNAFIRPASAGNMLGGVARGTKDTISLCEASGYKTIFIETVGVGQSEYWASKMADITILLIQPGAGDDIQGIKRGIMEMADIIIVTKADGTMANTAQKTLSAYKGAASLFLPRFDGAQISLRAVSSTEQKGFDEVLSDILQFYYAAKNTHYFIENRIQQESFWFEVCVNDQILGMLKQNDTFHQSLMQWQSSVSKGEIKASVAIHLLQNKLNEILNPQK